MSKLAEQLWAQYYPNPQITFSQKIWEPYQEPRRKHKRRRIQKKWIKRYGTITRYKIYRSPFDVRQKVDQFCREVIIEMVFRPVYREHRIAISPPLRCLRAKPPNVPSAKVEFKTVDYHLDTIGCIRNISAVLLQNSYLGVDKIVGEVMDRMRQMGFNELVKSINEQQENYGNQNTSEYGEPFNRYYSEY